MNNPNIEFWKNRRVLVTGHSGFKGSWLVFWLNKMGAKVIGIGLPPSTTPNLFSLANVSGLCESHVLDVRNIEHLESVIKASSPEIIFHLAAQALVRKSYNDPVITFDTNIIGTINLLNCLRGLDSAKVLVCVTTDKVYKNIEKIYSYQETDALGGYDPYSASKAASEIVISSYRDSFLSKQGVAVATARAGNVIGGGDWSDERLIPDAVRAWEKNIPLEVRRPTSVRPWQHVLEVLNGYIILAEKLYQSPSLAGAFNFGPDSSESISVREIIELAKKAFKFGHVLWGGGIEGPHEANLLSLDISKSKKILGLATRWNISSSIERTMNWYSSQKEGIPAGDLCSLDIASFLKY